MISYNEENANEIMKSKEKFPSIPRIHGVKGIHQAHVAAANICSTEMFWIVDGDAVLAEDFNFDYVAPRHRAVPVWRTNRKSYAIWLWWIKVISNCNDNKRYGCSNMQRI